MRLTRAQHDFDVSATKISTPRFSTTLISVEYLTTVDIHSIGHQPLKGFRTNYKLFETFEM